MIRLGGFFTAVAVSGALAIGALSVTPHHAAATTTDCADGIPDATGKVVANAGCEFSDLGNSQPTLAEINTEGFFDVNNWVELGKIETTDSGGGAGTDGDLKIDGSDINDEGEWEILNFDENLAYMLLFKDGSTAQPDSLIGYLITTESGTFGQVFSDCTNPTDASTCTDRTNAISNIRLFSVIPLPAAFMLLLTALSGFGFLGWRRRRRQMVAA